MTDDLSRTLTLLDRLVGFDTTSHKSNVQLVSWVRAYLAEHGIACQIIPDSTGEKQNLIAFIGPSEARGIVLSGHTDVVPADGEAWRSDPFRLESSGGRVFGRGSTDMKGFLAIVLSAVPSMVRAPLSRPITMAFSHDEEVGCLGTPALVAALPPKQNVIVGEPTSLRPATRHKGARVQTLSVHGVSAHSATPAQGVNAIAHMQPALAGLIALGETLSRAEAHYASNLVVTHIDGGGAPNVVPDRSAITWLLRAVDQGDASRVADEIAKIQTEVHRAVTAENPKAGVTLHTACDVRPFSVEASSMEAGFCRTLIENNDATSLPFATEAGLFAEAGHDVVVCGPGDMAQGHTIDEYIEISDLVAGQAFIRGVIDAACA